MHAWQSPGVPRIEKGRLVIVATRLIRWPDVSSSPVFRRIMATADDNAIGAISLSASVRACVHASVRAFVPASVRAFGRAFFRISPP